MNLEALAQNVYDQKQNVKNQRDKLSRATNALYDAVTALSEALCDANASRLEEVAIVLKDYDYVAICEWDGRSEYTMSFVPKVSNANT